MPDNESFDDAWEGFMEKIDMSVPDKPIETEKPVEPGKKARPMPEVSEENTNNLFPEPSPATMRSGLSGRIGQVVSEQPEKSRKPRT